MREIRQRGKEGVGAGEETSERTSTQAVKAEGVISREKHSLLQAHARAYMCHTGCREGSGYRGATQG